MESVLKTVKQDIAAAINAFEQDDFSDMNMYANRIMANAAFGDDEELFLTGFLLKDIAGLFLYMKAIPKFVALSTAKTMSSKYVSLLKEMSAGEKADLKILWVGFYQFYRDTRKFLMNDIEKKVYSDNTNFTRHSYIWLIRYTRNHKETLLDPNNFLFKGILNEMERIFRTHSGELDDVLAMSLIKALDRLYEYIAISRTSDGRIDEGKLKELIYPHLETIEQIAYPEKREQFSDVTKAIWRMTKQWREYFLQYMEVERVKPIQAQRAIELPADMKAKLAESISKTLEKEVKPE
jgi:hypothetical protein